MTIRTLHKAHERLIADLELLERRIGRVGERIESRSVDIRDEYGERLTEIGRRVSALLERVDDWSDVEIGTPTEVRHLTEDLDALETDLTAGSEIDRSNYEVAMDQQVRVWKSRLDALRVQGALASMELKDELADLSERLEEARSGVLIELQNTLDDSGDLVVEVRDDLEEVLKDVRRGLERAYEAVFDRSRQS